MAVEGQVSPSASCMSRMLANRIMRESIQHSVPHSYMPPGSSYPIVTQQTRVEDIARTEG